MTVYAGEIARIAITATLARSPTVSTPLVPADVTAATVSVWLSGGTEFVIEDEDLVWDDTHEVWRYNWDTTGVAAGSYKVKAMFTGPGGLRSWEFERVKISADQTLVEEGEAP